MTLEYIGSIGGIAGVLAFLLWLTVKYLIRQIREDRKFMEDRLTKIIDDYNKTSKDNQDVQREHTKVLAELYTYLRMRNGGKSG